MSNEIENLPKPVVIATGTFGTVNALAEIVPDAETAATRLFLFESATAIERVAGQKSQDAAALMIQKINTFIDQVDEVRVTAKQPFFDAGKKIDAHAKAMVLGLAEEVKRLRKCIGDYQLQLHLEQQKKEREAAEAQRKIEVEQARLKKVEDEALKKAIDTGSRAAIDEAQLAGLQQAQLNQQMERTIIVPEQVKSQGLSAKPVWKARVIDKVKLYNARPDLVELVPKEKDLNALAKSSEGQNPPDGIEFYQDVNVRIGS